MVTLTSWFSIVNKAFFRVTKPPIVLADLSPTSPIAVGSGTSAKQQVLVTEAFLGAAVAEVCGAGPWPDTIARATLATFYRSFPVTWIADVWTSYNYYCDLPEDFESDKAISPVVAYAIRTDTTPQRLYCATNPANEIFSYYPVNLTSKEFAYNLPSDYQGAMEVNTTGGFPTFLDGLNTRGYLTNDRYFVEGQGIYTDDNAPILRYMRKLNPFRVGGEIIHEMLEELIVLRVAGIISTPVSGAGSADEMDVMAEYKVKRQEYFNRCMKRGSSDEKEEQWGDHRRYGPRRG